MTITVSACVTRACTCHHTCFNYPTPAPARPDTPSVAGVLSKKVITIRKDGDDEETAWEEDIENICEIYTVKTVNTDGEDDVERKVTVKYVH